jgi:hypothetical protein
MNTKKIVSWVLIVVVLLVVALGFSVLANKVQAPTVKALPPSPILGGVATSSNAYGYVENKPYYTVDVLYPAKTPLSADANGKAVRIMEQALANNIAQFKKDGNFANLTAEDIRIQGLGADRKYAFGATYQQYQSAGTVSYVFTVYQDTLGAHPNSFYQTFTFDMSGNQVQLAGLFKPGVNYLGKLSPLAYAGVVAQLKEKTGNDQIDASMTDTVRMGTEPSPEALQFFYVDGNTLHLLFPPYQVAAYAAGAFDVAIPLSSLSDILK